MILVFGKSGQLARELAALETPSRVVVCAGRDRCDLAAGVDPRPLIDELQPRFVINAAAYTAVDKAETDVEAAYLLNRDASAAIAQACAGAAIPLVHVSTDYVFSGDKGAPYQENDLREPRGVYGASKAAGEDAVMAASGRSAIVRVGWLYSRWGSNFPKTMLRLARDRTEVGVVSDQHGRPTSARFVAEALFAICAMIERDPAAEGIFHLSPHGEATWADFAEAVFARSLLHNGPIARVKRITTAEYPTPARRPRDSRLDPVKLETLLRRRFPDWRALLDATDFDYSCRE